MKLPLQFTLRGIEPSETIEAAIREKADKLDQFYDRIMSCRVIVESPHRHHHKGKIYHVSIEITVPGKELVVKRDPGQHSAHEDIYVAIRDAFDAAKRQLEDYARQQRGDVKAHDVAHPARVTKLFPAQDYGILETPDKREIYFHRNSLIDVDFDYLDIGTDVLYIEEQGKQGPQAQQVSVGKHHVES